MASSCVAKSKVWACAFTPAENALEIVQEGVEARKTMRFADGSELEVSLSSSLPVSVRAISWQPSVVWT
ncbi:hypothetical protein ACLK1U_18970 [Escherichia coli]